MSCCYLDCDGRSRFLEDLDFIMSVRSSNVLRVAGIRTLEQLTRWRPCELMRQPNCGRKTVNELRELLASEGIRWEN